MKILFKILIILFIPVMMNAVDNNLIRIRQLYYKAAVNRTDAEVFFKTMQNSSGTNRSLTEGYKAMSFMIKANFSYNPYTKLSYFLKGKELLDNAILSNPSNLELRFLRYCVQTNAPAFLVYSGNITGDKFSIIENFLKLDDADLRSRVSEYMQNSKYCTKEEKKVFG